MSGEVLPIGKKDDLWKYGKEGKKKGDVICKFCDGKMNGGVFRLKHHLATIRGGDVRPCTKVPLDVQRECVVALKEISEKEFKRKRSEMMSTPPCPRFGVGVEESFTAASPSPFGQERVSRDRSSTEEVGSHGGGSSRTMTQSTLPGMAALNEERHKAARKAIAAFWYFSDLPFNVANSPYWRNMVEKIAACGVGFKPPTYHDLRGPLLEDSVQDMQSLLQQQREIWRIRGCTIMSDGWKDMKGRTLLNFLVATCDGIVFLKSVDATKHVKRAPLLAKLLGDIVMEVGPENVVQVITDNASNYVLAGKMLEERFPNLIWTPCAAHCLDLLLEDLGKLHWVDEVLQKAKTITKYIYNHSWVLHLMREYTGGKEIVRPGATRFATNFITMQSLFNAQGSLQKMFVGDEWRTEAGAKFKHSSEWKIVYDIIFEDAFWIVMEEANKITEPLVKVLRLVDGEKAPMGYVYEAMDKAKEAIKNFYNQDEAKYQPIWDIIDGRWTNQMHTPLHGAAHFLNPQFWFGKQLCTNYEVLSGLRNSIDRLVPNEEVRTKIQNEIQMYKKGEGALLKSPQAAKQKSIMLPHLWWEDFGAYTPNLMQFAIRILSQPCSASGCERNWSVFEHIHSKKRNRLTQEKLNDLVFVHYNLLLHHKQVNADSSSYEAIDLEQIDPSSEWITPMEREIHEVDEGIQGDEDQQQHLHQHQQYDLDIAFTDLENLAEELAAKGQEEERAQAIATIEAEGRIATARDIRQYTRSTATKGKSKRI